MDEMGIACLAQNIRENGQQVPIWKFKGKILDGRSRYLACKLIGEDPWIKTLPDETDPLAFVISLNLARRDLNPQQRKEVARQIFLRDDSYNKPSSYVARACGISPTTASRIRAELVRSGELPSDGVVTDNMGRQRPTTYSKAPKEETPARDQEEAAQTTAPPEQPPQTALVPASPVEPPPDAGDSWEPPTSAQDAAQDAEVVQAASAVRDFDGVVVGDDLKDIFADTFWATSMDQLNAMLSHVRDNQTAYPYLQLGLFTEAVTTVLGLLENGRPFRVCPECGGNRCDVCRSSGFWSVSKNLEQKGYA